MRMAGGIMLITILATNTVPTVLAQERAPTGTPLPSATEIVQPEKQGSKLPSAELVWSTSFRSASVVQPLWSGLRAEGHYFGGDENNIGFAGGSWTFHGDGWMLAPGFGVSFGDNGYRTMPALSLRWSYEHEWFISEGLYVQGLLHTKFFPEGTEPEPGRSASESVAPSIADGNHASVRWKRLTAGGTWEHMQFREGREWKGGVRVAYRVLPPLSFTFFALGPGSEVRGGILFEPEKK
jgi:hypothetical protein